MPRERCYRAHLPARQGNDAYDLREVLGRMKAARRASGKKIEAVARRLEVSPMTLKGYLCGSRGVTTDTISYFGVICGVPPAWLLTGAGEVPRRVQRLIDAGAMRYIDLDGKRHERRRLTELELVMGPYLSREARARDRTPLTECLATG